MNSSLSEAAQKSVAAAIEIANQRFGKPICVAVCDANGFLVAFHRMDGAPLRSVAISLGKAYTSVLMTSTTAEFGLRLKNEGLEASAFCDPRLTPLQGGIPVKDGKGVIRAGLGISGLKPDEDEGLALAVVEAVPEWR